jgi:hypothetical protein
MSGINVLLSNRRQQVLINQADATIKNLDDILDVDASNNVDGALIIFNSTTQKFESSITLNKQTIDGGIY